MSPPVREFPLIFAQAGHRPEAKIRRPLEPGDRLGHALPSWRAVERCFSDSLSEESSLQPSLCRLNGRQSPTDQTVLYIIRNRQKPESSFEKHAHIQEMNSHLWSVPTCGLYPLPVNPRSDSNHFHRIWPCQQRSSWYQVHQLLY